MRKNILLLLAFIILMHAGIVSSIFEIKQSFLKLVVLEEYSENDCFTIKLTFREFLKKRISDHEIIINKELHDIVKIKSDNGFVVLKLINDKIEKNYLNRTKDYKEKSNTGAKNKNQRLKINFLYYQENIAFVLLNNYSDCRKVKLNMDDLMNYLQNKQSIEPPPPEYTYLIG
ncbi:MULTISPECIES: hypothetical protein [Flavobacterium]|uniref:hypothetical protein n=1 Tax=Flavobacterium TaxID=237 RepID=UPI000745DBDA|nr:hypothetical protein [Flavobacterium covae]AMA49686.1 hypothetical protein AWN65_09550 [Flavobacterium covae]MCJ1810159.1 hypothetical protein [Flavobacterium covae]